MFEVNKTSILPKRRWSLPAWARRIIAVLLTFLAIYVLGRMLYADRDNLRAFEWHVHPIPLAGSFLSYSIYIGLAAFTWGSILKTMGSPASRKQHFRIYYISTLASRLPLPMGYILGRLSLYDERTSKTTISFASALELALIILAGLGTSFIFKSQHAPTWIRWGGIISLLLTPVIANPRILTNILTRWKGKSSYVFHYIQIISWLTSYYIVWMIGGCTLCLIITSIYPLSITLWPQVVGAWSISNLAVMMMIFLPVGLGVREVTLSLLLSTFLPLSIATLIAILSRVLLTFYEIIMAGMAFIMKE